MRQIKYLVLLKLYVFRKNSTKREVNQIVEELVETGKKNCKLDLAKAFNTINHKI